ncbi:MAG: hypothetical protein EXR75_13405 [Myxococcales bacterium]|nr:hypothetical protein [Myxococcales bacterium]
MLATILTACSASQSKAPPAPTLGATAASEREFLALREWFASSSASERAALDEKFATFCARYPGDPLGPVARALRALGSLEGGEIGRATSLAADALAGPPGTARDLAILVFGAAERRSGRPRDALVRLKPLLHKLIDPFATAMLDEELTRAAMADDDGAAAVRFMTIWLDEVSKSERPRVLEVIVALIGELSAEPLLAALEREVTASDAYLVRMRKAMARRLAEIARDRSDVALARKLLARHEALLGAEGEGVARLAADTSRERVIEGTVGLLLAVGTVDAEHRSAEVVAGVSLALGVGSGARLVVRDDRGRPSEIDAALAELVADGAAIIVIGIDARHLPPALRLSRENGVPVVLLAPDTEASQRSSPRVFLAGMEPALSTGMLAARMRERGARVVAALGSPMLDGVTVRGGSNGVGLELNCARIPPTAELRRENVDALIVVDGAPCATAARVLARELGAQLAIGLGADLAMRHGGSRALSHRANAALGNGATVTVGHDAEHAVVRGVRRGLATPTMLSWASAGVFPVVEAPPEPRLVDWFASGRDAPSWWTAVARDAAVLAGAAARHAKSAESADAVAASRLAAAEALATATSALWTSDATGFDSDRRIPRAVSIHSAGSR